ncbi:YtxH domain-containing protein [Clostridium sp. ZS2-4]|uniref:YtxH domain-containing protein n=1 Tax=Clostridium sp. ZS2-4 TaxID=2987703 RepID=UPI00227BC55A|nr:YtxH domain-containing protein [Clostridium sp. ZS2-4]MCY6355086.1 YtxH domain-containing protein [Clostridium sp. ZS2-4]
MNGKFVRGITTGAIIGVTAGMMMAPQVSRSTRKRMKKNGRNMLNTAEEVYDTFMDWMR